MTDNKEEKDILESRQETESPDKEAHVESVPETVSEKKETSEDNANNEKIRSQIESMELEDSLTTKVQNHASDLQSLEIQGKIEKLLQMAKEKGVVFAVHVAKKMNDPYLLDTFHDMLAKEGYYKEFLK